MKKSAKFIKKITDFLSKKTGFRIAVITLSTFFVLLTFSFFACYSGSQIERTAEYIAEVSKKDTLNHKYSWLSITEKKASQNKKKSILREPYDEYFFWKYIFRHSDYGYSKIANPNKDFSVTTIDYALYDDYSFLCANRNRNYKMKNSDNYHQEFYDLELMFAGTRQIKTHDSNFFAISKTDAANILSQMGVVKTGDDYSKNQYSSLLNSSIRLNINGANVSWTLDNIYLENTEFYKNLNSTIGHFLLTYILLPDTIAISDVFFFNTYVFQNMYKLERIASYYEKDDVDYNMCSVAFKNTDSFNTDVLFNGLFPKRTSPIFYVLVVVETLLAITLFTILILYTPRENKWFDIVTYLVPCLIPALILSVLSRILKNCLLFPFISAGFIVVFYILFASIFFFKLYGKGVHLK